MQQLNRKNASIHIERPIKVVQFGKGNFLRGFSCWLFDVLNEQTDFNGDIVIVSSHSKTLDPHLSKQEGLYHVLLKGIEKDRLVEETRLITCVRKEINPHVNFNEYIALSYLPALQYVVSNTTEAGIYFEERDLNVNHPSISFPAKLTTFLYHRFVHFGGAMSKGITLLPTELIPENANLLKSIVLRYIDFWKMPDSFKTWVLQANTFCNTLVDRIVSGFPTDKANDIHEQLGYQDRLVVQAEPFYSWHIEGTKSKGKLLPLTKGNLELSVVSNMEPYRMRKVRMLNGAHMVMVPLGLLKGLGSVQETIENPQLGPLLEKIIYREIIPTLSLPSEELNDFAGSVIERFKNPYLNHKLHSISLNGISKFRVRLLPTILQYRKLKNKWPQGLMNAFAHLLVLYKGSYGNLQFHLRDAPEVLTCFAHAWQQTDLRTTLQLLLEKEQFWGQDLTKIKGFSTELERYVEAVFIAEPCN